MACFVDIPIPDYEGFNKGRRRCANLWIVGLHSHFLGPSPSTAMESPKRSLIPSFLYASSSSPRSFLLDKSPSQKHLLIASPTEPGKRIEMYSPAFYAACTFGGILSCGLTHMAVTPLDLVKCNMQVCNLALLLCCISTIRYFSHAHSVNFRLILPSTRAFLLALEFY